MTLPALGVTCHSQIGGAAAPASGLTARFCFVEQLKQIGFCLLHLLRRGQVGLSLGLSLQLLQMQQAKADLFELFNKTRSRRQA